MIGSVAQEQNRTGDMSYAVLTMWLAGWPEAP